MQSLFAISEESCYTGLDSMDQTDHSYHPVYKQN